MGHRLADMLDHLFSFDITAHLLSHDYKRIAAIGARPAHARRVAFARDLFEVGGLDAIVDAGFDDPAVAAARLAASGATLARQSSRPQFWTSRRRRSCARISATTRVSRRTRCSTPSSRHTSRAT